MALKQAHRALLLQTPLGDDVLLLTAFRGREEMSRLFRFQLEMISDRNDIQPGDIVGKNVTFGVKLADDTPRYFNGFVSRFAAGDEDLEGRRNYWAEVVPWFWFLTRRTNCRVFQHKDVKQIFEQICGDLGFSDYELAQVQGNHPARDYCVQYRESDFAFLSRLLEEEGVFYFFRHENGKHTLVLGDQPGAYAPCAESTVDYPRDYGQRAMKDHITRWEHRYAFRSGKCALTDYNFEAHPARSEATPSKLLLASEPTAVSLPGVDRYERFDYPGRYGDKSSGQALARVRMEQEELSYDTASGESTCRTFTPGGVFAIGRHRSRSEQGKQYVITSVEHFAGEPMAYETGAAVEEHYRNKFSCIPAATPFRPPRATANPVVSGLQPAVVTGPAGEEIYTDKYGRVKVQFFWDREGVRDENTSCWVRVSQSMAGKNWGAVHIPRVGQEVLVAFLDGDPDQPLIVGRVYNADQTPPYPLPDGKNISGIKSNSTPGGGGYNEIILDDTKNNELIRIHAQYDMDSTVEHDQRLTVRNNRTDTIENDDSETVGGNQTQHVHGEQKSTVEQAVTENYNNTQTTTVRNKLTIVSAAADIEVQAATEIQLHVGASSILLKNDGTIEISGKEIKLSGTANVSLEAPQIAVAGNAEVKMGVQANTVKCDPAGVTTSGVMITASAQGVHTITGALVKIN